MFTPLMHDFTTLQLYMSDLHAVYVVSTEAAVKI